MSAEKATVCPGCGAALQSLDPAAPGYIPASARRDSGAICQRCFRIKHYNELVPAATNPDRFMALLNELSAMDTLVLHIVDIFDFEGSLIGGLPRFIGNNPMVLLVNKLDLLPKVTNRNRILQWVKRRLKEHGWKPQDIILCSTEKNEGMERVLAVITACRRHRHVCVVGAANAGKSTLVNRLIRALSDMEANITTSRFPGTTLDFVQIPLENGMVLIDTPGVSYKNRLTEAVTPGELRHLLPLRRLKPSVYQLNAGQTLFFGGYARFDFVEGDRQSFTCYLSNEITIHRTKLGNAQALYERQRGQLLAPPTLEQLKSLPPLTRHDIVIRPGDNSDIFISGLGWIRVNGSHGGKFVLHAPKGIRVGVREAMI